MGRSFILNESLMWRGERFVSGSDSFSRSCALSYRVCTGISSPVSSLQVFPSRSFITWLMQCELERELISSPFESSGLSRSSRDSPIRYQCSLREKDFMIKIITNSLIYYLCYHIQCYSCSCGSVVEHCVSSAKGCGFDSQGTHILMKMYNLNATVSRFG